MSEFATSTTEIEIKNNYSENTSDIPDPKVIQEQTLKSIEERKARFNATYDLAIAEIVKGSGEKIKSDCDKGKFSSILYTFYYSDDKNSEFDNKNNKIKFNNIYLLDMITKGRRFFFKRLDNYFNNNSSSKGYHCNYFFNKHTKSYNIYVSWAPKDDNKDKVYTNKSETTTNNSGEAFKLHRPPFNQNPNPNRYINRNKNNKS